MLGVIFATTLLQDLMYPVIYKFGIEKARITIFVVVFGIVLIASIIGKIIDFKPLLESLKVLNSYWIFILPIIMVLFLYTSYKISERVYQQKDY